MPPTILLAALNWFPQEQIVIIDTEEISINAPIQDQSVWIFELTGPEAGIFKISIIFTHVFFV